MESSDLATEVLTYEEIKSRILKILDRVPRGDRTRARDQIVHLVLEIVTITEELREKDGESRS